MLIKWKVFVDWCKTHNEDPVTCPVSVILSFLQDRLNSEHSPSALMVYVAGIASFHAQVDQ